MPGPSTVKEERVQLKKWEVVYVDTSGKFQVKSARVYFYYSVLVDRKDVEKISIGHAKKRHLPITFLQYTVCVGSWSRLLISDGAGELIETKIHRQLLTRDCKHEVTARDEHHVNVPAE